MYVTAPRTLMKAVASTKATMENLSNLFIGVYYHNGKKVQFSHQTSAPQLAAEIKEKRTRRSLLVRHSFSEGGGEGGYMELHLSITLIYNCKVDLITKKQNA